MATIKSSSPIHSPQENPTQSHSLPADRRSGRTLAIRLADSIVTRSYAPLIWSLYHRRFLAVLDAVLSEQC